MTYVHDLCALTLAASNDHNIGIIISQEIVYILVKLPTLAIVAT